MDEKSLKTLLRQGDLDVGARVKKARVFLGFTQPVFAEPLGISRSKLANIETGRTVLSYGLAIQICRVYILNEWWLASGQGNVRSYQNWSSFPELLNVDQSRPFLDVFAENFTLFLIKEESPTQGLDVFERIEIILNQDGQNVWQLWNLLQYLLTILDPRPEYPGHSDPALVPFYRNLIQQCHDHMVNGLGGKEKYDQWRRKKNLAREEFEGEAKRMVQMMLNASPELSD
jgi:transcriptional regulator with XRE-family HTH domain